MATYKNPYDLAESFTSPFNVHSINRNKKQTPRGFFADRGDGSRLIHLSPNDYYKLVASQSGTTPEKLMKHRQDIPNELSVGDIRKKMRAGEKFDTPWISLLDKGEKGTVSAYWQEGLHRMLAAGQEYGMDTKMPVYLGYENDPWNEIETMSMDDFINHYDKTRLERYNKYKAEQDRKEQEWHDLDVKLTARHFGIPESEVTPEKIKEYEKWEDSLWDDVDLRDYI